LSLHAPCVRARKRDHQRPSLRRALLCCVVTALLCCGAASAQLEPILPSESEEELDLAAPLAELPRPAQTPRPPMTPVAVIVLDPGHGGNDAGATGVGGLVEKTVTLAVAQRLQTALLDAMPGQVLLTRNEDVDRTDAARVNHANTQEAGLFISLHTGASYSPAADGIEAFYHGPTGSDGDRGRRDAASGEARRIADSRRLGDGIAQALSLATNAANRGVHGVESRILRNVKCPAVLIELGCLTNPGDEARLSDEAYLDQLAQGLAAGILQYIDPGRAAGETP